MPTNPEQNGDELATKFDKIGDELATKAEDMDGYAIRRQLEDELPKKDWGKAFESMIAHNLKHISFDQRLPKVVITVKEHPDTENSGFIHQELGISVRKLQSGQPAQVIPLLELDEFK